MTKDERDIYIELFKRKEYKSIPLGSDVIGEYFYPVSKQVQAFELINDDQTTFIGYGGTARTGKSIIEASQIIFDCLLYPGIAWGLARKELTILKRTVLLTFFKQCEFYGLKADVDFTFNQQLNKIVFKNNSEVFLIDTAFKPSEPLNTKFGGFELTRCAVDESNETEISVLLKLLERTGWRKNEEYKLKRKVFECFNSAQNHVYERYWIPYREKNEPENKKFIHAQPTDMETSTFKEWMEDMLKNADEATVQRQVYGNFDYDNDPSALCSIEAIRDVFTNDHVKTGDKKISADLAMQGRDRFVAGYMDGGIITVEIDKLKSTGKEIEEYLTELKNRRSVPNSKIVADSDGLGAYLSSYIQNIKTFHGGSNKCDGEYANVKTQCAYILAEKINNREIKIICTAEQRERIVAEISICLKRDNLDADISKKKLISKEVMKLHLNRSPDYFDMILMFFYFEINKPNIYPVWV